MAKPTGFMEYKKESTKYLSPAQRIKNFDEFLCKMDDESRKKQAARCMDCGIPFCHSALLISGITSGCPINNLIPEWNDLIYKGLLKDAYIRLAKTNNFPEFTGRVCPAPCEGSCTLGINEPCVSIKNNECHIIDTATDRGWLVANPPTVRTDKKVAIVGSGPSGLACADQLNKAGHNVTVFERADRIGGLLMYGIPNMKLPKNLISKRIELLSQEGIHFVTNTNIGIDYPVQKLISEFDAIILCTGSTVPRDISIKGRELGGIYFAMDFLKSNTKSLLDSNHSDNNYINAKGKNVIVIGGGDTGTDCVATSVRHGANSVVQFEIMPSAPIDRAQGNPWPEYPRVLKTDYGHEEAKAIFGNDPRNFCIMSKEFIGDENGNLKEILTVDVEWQKNENGQLVPIEIQGTQKYWSCDIAFICLGFLGPEKSLLDCIGVEQDNRSNAKAIEGQYTTNIPKVFACGDARRGQSLVVWAIREGREAAKQCDKYLMGYTNLP